MPTLSAVEPSTRPLSEVARHLVVPSGIVDTLWFEVEERCREFGDEFDVWQDGLGQVALGIREDGLFAATIGGVTLSIPRQVAKTFLVGRIVVALCSLFPDLTVVWTAHRTRTATNTFQKLKGFVLRPAARGYLRAGSNQGTGIRDANGEQEIPFINGSRIMFGARESGFGRGFDEVDIEVFDEAQILTEKALEDMVAATNQSRFPHGALLFYMGTPPRPVDPGEVFTVRRGAALEAAERRSSGGDAQFEALYVECSADPEKAREDPNDQERWAEANPSFPHRTPLVSLLRLRSNLPGDDSWLREGLGVWDEEAGVPPLITRKTWAKGVVEEGPSEGLVAYGVKFSPDGETVALSAAMHPVGGAVHVEGVAHRQVVDGTRWLVEWLSARTGRVVIDGKSGAGALVSALTKARVKESRIVRPVADQVMAAHAGFVEAITAVEVSHLNDEALDTSVLGATRRPIGSQGGWGFAPIGPHDDVTLAESAVLAHWAASLGPKRAGSVW